MNRSDLEKEFESKDIDEATDLNALVVAEGREFRRPDPVHFRMGGTPPPDYRERALKFVTQRKLPFSSTSNSVFNVCKAYIKIACPYCGGETAVIQGGGNSEIMTVTYRCDSCKAEMGVSLPENGFFARPNTR